jgi:hypothetical protein
MSVTIRDANHFGPLTEERLAKLEAKLNGQLAEDYRSFLLKYNGGRPDRQRFLFTGENYNGEEQESILEWFFAVHDRPYDEDAEWEENGDDDFLPYFAQPLESVLEDYRSDTTETDTVPIARDPCGNLITLGLSGTGAGKVYFYDHEIDAATLLADRFTEFLDRLLPTEA